MSRSWGDVKGWWAAAQRFPCSSHSNMGKSVTHKKRKSRRTNAPCCAAYLCASATRRDFRFLWVTDFPMFEWDEEGKRWAASHHPFTSPHERDMEKLSGGLEAAEDPNSPLAAVRALAYDVVLNGTELGSGSIRIHRQDI